MTEVRNLFTLAWPQSMTQLTSYAPGLVLLGVVGHLQNGAVLVGAAGTASMYSNFAHKMLLVATSFGVMPLFSQAFGAGNHHRVGLILMRVLLFHLCLAMCISLPLTAAAGPLFTAFGLPPAVVEHAQSFLWIRLLGVPGLILFFDIQFFLNAQRFVKLPMAVMIAGSLAQVGFMCVLAGPDALGFLGTAWALTMVETVQGLLLLAAAPWLLHRHKLHSWPSWCRELRQAFTGWAEIVSRGGPACVMIISEWLGWECTLFIASGLCTSSATHSNDATSNTTELVTIDLVDSAADSCPIIEAIPICTAIFVCQFLIAFGPGLAANVRVGNLLGEGRPRDARNSALIALAMAMSVQVLLATGIMSFRGRIASAFVDDPVVHAHTVALLPYTTAYSFLATAVSGWSQQILFGLGARLRFPAALNFLAFFAVGLPAGALFGYHGLEERGIWLGLLVALLLALVGQYAYLLLTTDWQVAATKARERALGDIKATTTGGGESEGRGLAAADSAIEVL